MSVIGALALSGCAASGQENTGSPGGIAEGCSSFKGKTVELVIPYNSGGGYDILARVIIPGLENALGAKVLPINKPGAGGLLAINQLTAAPPDGTQIAIVNGTGAAAAILAGAEGPEFGFDDLSYIGRVAADDLVVTTNADSGYQTWDDVTKSDGFKFGSTGRGSSDYIVANMLIQAFALKNAEVVVGFNSQSETDLALIQGNVDAIAGPLDSRRASIKSGETTAVLSFAEEAPADAAEATVFGDLELSEDTETLLDDIKSLTEFGRPLVAPAGMEPETLSCLQDALAAAVEDPEVLQQAEKMQRELSYVSGEDLRTEVIPRLDEVSTRFLDVLKASY
ncbi:tripartite tricarboxylate transporter substrate binding protein [uncultured Citricoccus sp.]|uniref:Bug family tripartite tricarboxylate transporter substrate binding protein n=1 Tax=uncultured Citricoccus sp. TaxID=614031 RepID=UPI00262BDC3D|nr:tripartite tricarboxylate transporter substrate-binding protein [uncultured Citricoccus sp.]